MLRHEIDALARFGVAVMAFLLTSCGSPAATPSPFNGDRAYADLERIVALGPRVAGSLEASKTRAIIRSELKAAGVRVNEYPFTSDTPLGAREMVNVVGVVQGTLPGVILLGNHYDTKYFQDFEFVGANDGGSTTAWMIEMARAIGPSREGYSVWLCWFDGEEAFVEWTERDSLYGSRAMVKRLVDEGTLPQVKAMINVDMIGDCDLEIFKDRDAPGWLLEALWGTARAAGHTRAFGPVSDSVKDDHLPFRRAGVPAMNVIDFRYGGGRAQHQMNWHTPRDRLDRVCAESLQVVGDVIYRGLDVIDQTLRDREKARDGSTD